jgi:hypothetical protein
MDKVIVMHQGSCAEVDIPYKLLVNEDHHAQITKTDEDGEPGKFA